MEHEYGCGWKRRRRIRGWYFPRISQLSFPKIKQRNKYLNGFFCLHFDCPRDEGGHVARCRHHALNSGACVCVWGGGILETNVHLAHLMKHLIHSPGNAEQAWIMQQLNHAPTYTGKKEKKKSTVLLRARDGPQKYTRAMCQGKTMRVKDLMVKELMCMLWVFLFTVRLWEGGVQKWLDNNCSKFVSACWMGVDAARNKLRARTLENHMRKI